MRKKNVAGQEINRAFKKRAEWGQGQQDKIRKNKA